MSDVELKPFEAVAAAVHELDKALSSLRTEHQRLEYVRDTIRVNAKKAMGCSDAEADAYANGTSEVPFIQAMCDFIDTRPQQSASAAGLVEALKKIVDCYDRNWQHQREKIDDVVPLAREALATYEAGRDWPADYAGGENKYECRCVHCQSTFHGHKRRVCCRLCATLESGGPESEEAQNLARAHRHFAHEDLEGSNGLHTRTANALEAGEGWKPKVKALDPYDWQLLFSLEEDEAKGVNQVVENDQERWILGFRLSDIGYLAMVSHPKGGTFHLTRLGRKAIADYRTALDTQGGA